MTAFLYVSFLKGRFLSSLIFPGFGLVLGTE